MSGRDGSRLVVPGTSVGHVAASRPGEGRLRYLTGGDGPPLVLLHTVRTQAEHFRELLPLLLPHHTAYALDLPGMGHSEIVPGASYDEPQLRAGVTRLLESLDLRDVVLVGESIGAVLALTVAGDHPDRVRGVVAVNPYDYSGGLARSGLLARGVLAGIATPGIGRLVAHVEPRPVMRAVLRGGLVDTGALREDYLGELLAVGRRPGYARVARAVYGNLPSMITARSRYRRVQAPTTLLYGARDWSRPSDRAADRDLLPEATYREVDGVGHFVSLERPDLVADAVAAHREGPHQEPTA